MNITITGNLGSGKTSVCKELEKSGFTIISAGDIFREIAREKGMTVIELNEAAKKDRSIDDLLDSRSTELGKKMDHTVFDSRLAWHFVENSFKVFLLVDTQEAARRVFAGNSRSAEEYRNVQEAGKGLEARAKLEQERFRRLYGIDYYDAGNYDLIIESSCAAPEQIAQEIMRNFELYQQQPFPAKAELNLKCLYPAKHFEEADKSRIASQCLEEKENAGTLCAEHPVSVIIKKGYNYLDKDCHYVLGAIASGKVFAEVKDMHVEGAAQETLTQLTESDIQSFEKEAGFCYQASPVQTPEKQGYTLDFTKLFKK